MDVHSTSFWMELFLGICFLIDVVFWQNLDYFVKVEIYYIYFIISIVDTILMRLASTFISGC